MTDNCAVMTEGKNILRTRDISKEKDLDVYQRTAAFAQLYADPVRLELLDVLSQGARSVESICEICALSVKTVSHHLQKLLQAGLVTRTKQGRRAIYAIADEFTPILIAILRQLARTAALADEPFRIEQHGDRIHARDLISLVRHNKVLVIDVRPADEYMNGHLPGAVSIPGDSLHTRLDELPRDKPIVAFCRGPYCKLADHAVTHLKSRGFMAIRCEEGVAELMRFGIYLEKQG